MKALLAGWFSFAHGGATAGDTMAADVAFEWLTDLGHVVDVATDVPFEGGVDWLKVRPDDYDAVLFVCGPFGRNVMQEEFVTRFAGRPLIGLNVSMVEPIEVWQPFDVLLERDSSRAARPDIAFAARELPVPLVGVCLAHPQPEYGRRAVHELADVAIRRLTESRPMSVIEIDTRLGSTPTGFVRSAAEVESRIAHADVVLTTRLHGLVLSLRNGVPVVAVDPVAGGAKVSRQAELAGWPVVLTSDDLSDGAMNEAYDYCLTEEARHAARAARERALETIGRTRAELGEALGQGARPGAAAAASHPPWKVRPMPQPSGRQRALDRLLTRARALPAARFASPRMRRQLRALFRVPR
jgi:hypothetical protein